MDDEYVLKEDILKYLEKKSNISIGANTMIGKDISRAIDVLYCDIDNMVSADVQPVKRGRWMNIHEWCELNGYKPSGLGLYYWCSECNKSEKKKSDYCPNCGADMRGTE